MPGKCFVPGCKTGYLKQRKENEKAGIKNPSIFSAPKKDSQLLEKWKQIIPRTKRELSSKDKVCELHFEEECIEREYSTLMPDGSVNRIPKEKVTLKKGSIPTIFENSRRKERRASTSPACSIKKRKKPDSDLENVTPSSSQSKKRSIPTIFQNSSRKERQASTSPACSSKNKRKKPHSDLENVTPSSSQSKTCLIKVSSISIQSNNNLPQLNDNLENADISLQSNDSLENVVDNSSQSNDSLANVVDNSSQSNDSLENVVDNSSQLNYNLEKVVDVSPMLNDGLENIDISPQSNDDNVKNAVINTPSPLTDFFKFSVEVKSMTTPSWWSVANTEDFVMFVKWNQKHCSERRLVICRDLSIKIYLMNVEVSLPIEECTIENLTHLLKKVDDFKICQNAESGTSPACRGFCDGRIRAFCPPCTKSMSYKKDVERRRNRMKSIKRDIFREMKVIRRRSKRLENKILLLKSKLAESRYQCSKTKKKAFLEAIAHLPIQDQAAIESCLFGSKNASVRIHKENNSDKKIEDLSSDEYSEDNLSDFDENRIVAIREEIVIEEQQKEK